MLLYIRSLYADLNFIYMVRIELEKKLVSSNLPSLLQAYWKKSFESKYVTFLLNELEWISNSEISLLFSWMKSLQEKEIIVSIELPSGKDIPIASDSYKSRVIVTTRLLIQWRLQEHFPNVKLIGGIKISSKSSASFSDFSSLPIIDYKKTFDKDFEKLYETHFKNFRRELKKNLLKTEIDYYDSQFLNYSIIKELYSNVCLHSETNKKNCFLSIGVNKRYKGDSEYVSTKRLEELSLEKIFFEGDNKKYRNIDFIEITFHDFGIGIATSLKEKYQSESRADLKLFFKEHLNGHLQQNLDTRVIEYAILLFTSKFEIDRKFEIHDYIPRGLFILKDIVKKYNGYFEITSNTGGLSLNFKEKPKIEYIDKLNKDLVFPGTRIKIILPSYEKPAFKDEGKYHKRIQKKNKNLSPEYITLSFLNEYVNVESEFINSYSARKLKTKLISGFFNRLFNSFKTFENNTIILIDFGGVEPQTIDFFNKFIYFICHFPFSSDRHIILVNLVTKGLNKAVIFHSDKKLKSRGFSPYPIPCISVDLSVEWLGINDENVANNFTELWKGNTKNEYVNVDLATYRSDAISIDLKYDSNNNPQSKIEILLPEFKNIIFEIKSLIESTIKQELDNVGLQFYQLKDNRKNYNDIIIKKEKTVFLTSSGNYLLEYISFNEKLYLFAYRRMISAYFVFNIYADANIQLHKVNKILSVTLSSQLIGNEVKDIINDISESQRIELIALSSYSNFQNEQRFSDIKPNEKLLIINDVVLTGSLIQDIIKAIEIKGAVNIKCLSIVDSRGSNDKLELDILSLANRELEKLSTKPNDHKTEWINPVLNVPISLPKKKEFQNVLFNQNEFLDRIEESYLKVGNLYNNPVYFNYYLDTEALLKNESKHGFPFLKEIIEKIKEDKDKNNHTDLDQLSRGIKIVANNIGKENVLVSFTLIQKETNRIFRTINPSLFEPYKVDLVLYPFLSNIQVIEHDPSPFFSLNNEFPKVYPLPRIMTSRGWRFSFPPKFLNIITKEKKLSVLLIDDGTLSGNTIMQMIDAATFLPFKSIDVLAIFGRLEDFQTELFSRIKSVKSQKITIPINIYFGTHFNIPIHNIHESPYQSEWRRIVEFENLLNQKNISLTDGFERFLTDRKKIYSTGSPPKKAKDDILFESVSKKELFRIRDLFGRFSSYRIYSSDIPIEKIEALLAEEIKILHLLTVVNIEPHLYQTLRRIFPKEALKKLSTKIIDEFLINKKLTNSDKKIEFLIKSLFLLNRDKFFNPKLLMSILNKLKELNSQNAYRYIEYLLVSKKLNLGVDNNSFNDRIFENNIFGLLHKLRIKNIELFNEFRFAFSVFNKTSKYELLNLDFPINKYYHLRGYFADAEILENGHDEKLRTNLFKNSIKTLSELKHSIENNISDDIDENKSVVIQELKILIDNYEKLPEFRFIKDIVTDLKRYSFSKLSLDADKLFAIVLALESSMKESHLFESSKSIQDIEDRINLYIKSLLQVNSKFVDFIMQSSSHINEVWESTEDAFANSNKNYIRINNAYSENFQIDVNQYALKEAFENLLKNKDEHAPRAKWEMYTKKVSDYIELYFKQDAPFKYDKGDGTGQHMIKSILKNYGVLYQKETDIPYLLKITFTKT